MAQDTAPPSPALKEIFNLDRLSHIARETAAVSAGFDQKKFLRLASADLESLGIMQRMRQVATSLHATLPGSFADQIETLKALAPRVGHGFVAISLSEFIALYGEPHFDLSMDALQFFTRFGSAEFAIRPFLLRDLRRTLSVMERWALDDSEHARRLASEGCRPRLPWSFKLRALIDDPRPVATILDRLKSDDSLYVRKSVANHLNDITKDHPDWVFAQVAGWHMNDPRSAWIARHALRTLIKKGDPRALGVIGAGKPAKVEIVAFSVTPGSVKLGDRIRIDARIASTAKKAQRLVVDYAIHYVKKSGSASRKVFKLKEFDLSPDSVAELSISQMVRDFTTRKHYPGHHAVDLMVNGKVMATSAFDLAA